MEEVWKHVENFEGYYEVSNLGRVRRNWHGKYKLLKTGYVGGYQRVILSKEGTQTSLAVHRLVMESFKGIDFETLQKGFEVHHLDEDPSNNRPENLIIVTKSQNQRLSAERRFKKFKQKIARRMDKYI